MFYFIVNVKSRAGKAKRIWKRVEQELVKQKVEYKSYFTGYAGHASVLADQICEEDEDVIKKIVVVGGDGTVNEVINGIADYNQVVLGYIPSGSSNDLARGLGIPRDPLAALEHILHAKTYRYIDHGQINYFDENPPRRFAVSSGIGFDASVCKEAMHSRFKNVLNCFGLGKLTYAGIALRQILSSSRLELQVIYNDAKKCRYKNVFFLAAMIQKYEGGGLPMAPAADPSDGLLSVCLVHGMSKWKVLFCFPLIFFGKHVLVKGIEIVNCSSVEIRSLKPADVHTDGEVGIPRSHIRMSLYPDKIRMIL